MLQHNGKSVLTKVGEGFCWSMSYLVGPYRASDCGGDPAAEESRAALTTGKIDVRVTLAHNELLTRR